jgi:hypothetical protein
MINFENAGKNKGGRAKNIFKIFICVKTLQEKAVLVMSYVFWESGVSYKRSYSWGDFFFGDLRY